MKSFLLIFAAVLILASCESDNEPKTIYIVRHGEKQLAGTDPELAVAGQARADKLSQILDGENIKHIFSTPYKRTRDTAAPTALAAGIEIQTYDPSNHDSLVAKLRSLEGNILVVGHSNTVSKLANYFIGEAEKFEDLDDIDYEYIYIVSLGRNGESIIRKTYKDF